LFLPNSLAAAEAVEQALEGGHDGFLPRRHQAGVVRAQLATLAVLFLSTHRDPLPAAAYADKITDRLTADILMDRPYAEN
jgi:hypothetical protein